jgi:predicted aconitase with swiveling domain
VTRTELKGRVLFPGTAHGPLLKLSAPLSFWGGIDPQTGEIILGSHPERGRNIQGTILALADPIGSSSSSYVMLELIHRRVAPAAVLLGQPDAILIVGCLVARELGYAAPPVLHIGRAQLNALAGAEARISGDLVEVLP